MLHLPDGVPMSSWTSFEQRQTFRLPPVPAQGKSPHRRGGALGIRTDGSIAIHRAQLVEHLVQRGKIALAVEPVACDHKVPCIAAALSATWTFSTPMRCMISARSAASCEFCARR